MGNETFYWDGLIIFLAIAQRHLLEKIMVRPLLLDWNPIHDPGRWGGGGEGGSSRITSSPLMLHKPG